GRVGARLLPEVPEPPARLHRRVVERGQLAEGGRAVRRGRLSRAGHVQESGAGSGRPPPAWATLTGETTVSELAASPCSSPGPRGLPRPTGSSLPPVSAAARAAPVAAPVAL